MPRKVITECEQAWRDGVKPIIDQYNRLVTWGASPEIIRPFYYDMEEAKRFHKEKYYDSSEELQNT